MEGRIQLIWGDWILDGGFTSVPNVLLKNVARLGITDRELHFIIQLASFKYTADLDIFPSYKTLEERMGKDIRNIRSTARSLEEKGLLKRVYRKTEDGDYDTTIFDLSPLVKVLQGTGEIIRRGTDDFVTTGADGTVRRIKRNSDKENNGEENDVANFSRSKGLSEGQIALLLREHPDIGLSRCEKVWEWIYKTKYFKNKPAVFYSALLEEWSVPDPGNKRKKKDLPWL